MKDNRQLLCTFASISNFKEIVEEIKKFYNVNNKIFVFSNVKNPEDIYITYNIVNNENKFPKFRNTISIHRKKQTNTLYSLNALNCLIKEETGHLDNSYEINWKLYENSLIISGDISVRIISLKIYDIIN